VRLRFEAVAALAFKAVGTKPKAGSVPPPTMSKTLGMTQAPISKPREGPAKPQEIKIDFSDTTFMIRLIKRGLRSGDTDWRQAWTQFCWKRDLRSQLSSRNKISPPKEALVAFLEANLSKLRASWARGLEEDRMIASRSRSNLELTERGRPRQPQVREAREAREGREGGESEDWSSSFESERSRRRKKRRKEKKGIRGYSDFFTSKPKHMTPEVMMMRAQMMGFSMVMDNSLAMMSMRTPMMPPVPAVPPMLPREGQGRPYGQLAPPPPPPPQTPSPAPVASVPSPSVPSVPSVSSSNPLPKSAVAAARKQQQESTIDMDDL